MELYKHGYITRALGTFHSSMRAAYKFSEDLKRLPRNPNKSGLLTDLPDYTFLDGRVTPLGANQTKRLLQQREIATKVVVMSREMDFAVERYNVLQERKLQQSEKFISLKLKSKGFALI
uniref:Large ribosomal subunit protein mL52 n=1 Tax=Aedes albopictus TaxID=7160 RepID=A0A023EDT0_AEDAL